MEIDLHEFWPGFETMMNILTGPKNKLIFDHFINIIHSRPKTLVHYDLDCNNLFVDKKDRSIFTIIDW